MSLAASKYVKACVQPSLKNLARALSMTQPHRSSTTMQFACSSSSQHHQTSSWPDTQQLPSTRGGSKMTTTKKKEAVFVVVQLSGGNDFMNTVVPYGNPLYYDFRKTVDVAEDRILHIDQSIGLHPSLPHLKKMYDAGKVAIIQCIGYPQPDRSHFRSMDIWHTAQPESVISEGWLGRTIP